MGRTTDLRREIKKVFLPFVIAKGFVLDEKRAPTFWEFRRTTRNGVQVFEIQWEKYGRPRFRVNFGTCPPNGLVIDGKNFAPNEVLATWLPEFGYLQPRRGLSPRSWFRQDKPLTSRLLSSAKLYPAARVVGQLMDSFPELETYWSSGMAGAHVRIVHVHTSPSSKP